MRSNQTIVSASADSPPRSDIEAMVKYFPDLSRYFLVTHRHPGHAPVGPDQVDHGPEDDGRGGQQGEGPASGHLGEDCDVM